MEMRPGGYLSGHIEEMKTPEQRAVDDREIEGAVDVPIVDGLSADYNSLDKIHFENGEFTFDLAFTKVSDEMREERLSQLELARKKASLEEAKMIDELIRFYSPDILEIDQLRLQRGERVLDLDNEKLRDKYPDLKIFFNPKRELNVWYRSDSGEILASGDMTKLGSILGVLHEIGHGVNTKSESGGARSRYNTRENITENEGAQILKNERDAWAFALTGIKPFLNKETRDVTLQYVHQYALQEYSTNIKNQIAPNWKLFIAHIEEYLEDVF